jgi:hypothetical protein
VEQAEFGDERPVDRVEDEAGQGGEGEEKAGRETRPGQDRGDDEPSGLAAAAKDEADGAEPEGSGDEAGREGEPAEAEQPRARRLAAPEGRREDEQRGRDGEGQDLGGEACPGPPDAHGVHPWPAGTPIVRAPG